MRLLASRMAFSSPGYPVGLNRHFDDVRTSLENVTLVLSLSKQFLADLSISNDHLCAG
jgi:hypothetical protein